MKNLGVKSSNNFKEIKHNYTNSKDNKVASSIINLNNSPELCNPPGPNVPNDVALVLFLILWCAWLWLASAAAIDLGTNSGISGMMSVALTSGCDECGAWWRNGGKSADMLFGRKSGGGTPGGGGPGGGGGPLGGIKSLIPAGGAVLRAPGTNSIACGFGPCRSRKHNIN